MVTVAVGGLRVRSLLKKRSGPGWVWCDGSHALQTINIDDHSASRSTAPATQQRALGHSLSSGAECRRGHTEQPTWRG